MRSDLKSPNNSKMPPESSHAPVNGVNWNFLTFFPTPFGTWASQRVSHTLCVWRPKKENLISLWRRPSLTVNGSLREKSFLPLGSLFRENYNTFRQKTNILPFYMYNSQVL